MKAVWLKSVGMFGAVFLVCTATGWTASTYLPVPYAQGPTWPAQHHDAHNSDWIPLQIRPFLPSDSLKTVYWLGREPEAPSVPMAGGAFTGERPYSHFFTTRGKVEYPNIEAYNLGSGELLW